MDVHSLSVSRGNGDLGIPLELDGGAVDAGCLAADIDLDDFRTRLRSSVRNTDGYFGPKRLCRNDGEVPVISGLHQGSNSRYLERGVAQTVPERECAGGSTMVKVAIPDVDTFAVHCRLAMAKILGGGVILQFDRPRDG